MALPSYLYQDPLKALIGRENRTCKGCRYLEELKAFGETKEFCLLRRKKLRKCGMYGHKRLEGDK